MKNKLVSSLLLLASFAIAQNAPNRCSTVEHEAQRALLYPLESRENFEMWMAAKVAELKASPEWQSGERVVVTLPIVFHVIHNGDGLGSGENISQAQVNSQITVLNEDFRKMVGTPGNNNNAVGADCEIEFCAALVDPNGNILNEPGIDRRNMGQTSWQDGGGGANDIEVSLKPQTYWDPNRYVNVWTVRFGGNSANLLGYAQFPNSTLAGIGTNNGGATTDGVVISYSSCGRVGTLAPPYEEGRTLTHELGHFFGLRHIWGDGSNCNATDYCDDTPKSDAANYGCPNTNSCTDVPDLNDMVQNYMDYTDDACMNIFTQDQKERFWVVLTNSVRRASLTTSDACIIPAYAVVTGQVLDASNNQGIAGAQVLLDGNSDFTAITDANGNFTINNVLQSNYSLYAGKWGYVTNTMTPVTITANPSPITISLNKGYYDDFLMDFGWTVATTATSGAWVRGEPAGTTYTANGTTYQSNPEYDVTGDYGDKAFVTGNAGGTAGNDDVDGGQTVLTCPAMNLSLYAEPIVKYYRWFYNAGGNSAADDSIVVTATSGGQTAVIDKAGRSTGSSSNWVYRSIRLKDFIPNPGSSVTLAYRIFDSSTGHIVEGGLDFFQVIDSLASSAQAPVANLGASNTTICAGEQISFNDLSTNSPISWQWQFEGGIPQISNSQNAASTYITPGVYDVTLIATNGAGTDTIVMQNYITVQAVEAAFVQSQPFICPGDTISFTNTTVCPTSSLLWSFPGGNPTTSMAAVPVVQYDSTGLYDVQLIASNQYGSDTLLMNLTVEVSAPAVVQTGAVPDIDNTGNGSASVSVTSGTTPFSYAWSNGATTDTIKGLPAGDYTVTVTDGDGCKTVVTVTVDNINGIAAADHEEYLLLSAVSGTTLFQLRASQNLQQVSVYAASGAVVKAFDGLQQPQLYFETAGLPTGIYLLEVLTADGKMHYLKMSAGK